MKILNWRNLIMTVMIASLNVWRAAAIEPTSAAGMDACRNVERGGRIALRYQQASAAVMR